ncbi:hypothetical protein [Paraburkholderia dinghuensis]|uniref:Uncharacterized protein n=1 Tax=Paraburkholderia dinghuensis TaxID=2305225 RepID=A0A3N6MFS4_9BURK|nr:hypothetical protein [Paraburkholderia dinghuensis]RQG99814.1 hypothetical protein D1Y85_26165 [Paraburkholderia dinghuensis]
MSCLFRLRRDAAMPARELRGFFTLAGAVCLGFALTACDQGPPSNAASAASAPEVATAVAPETTIVEKDPLALPTGDLDDETIANYLHAAMDYEKPDQFSKGFNDAPLVGRHFNIDIPYQKYSTGDERGPTYSYDADKELLTLTVAVDSAHREADEYTTQYLTFFQDIRRGEPKLESNAFNVTKEVTPLAIHIFGVGALSDTYIGLFSNEDFSSKSEHYYRPLTKTVKLKPDAAKEAVRSLTIEVEGTVTKDHSGHAIECTTMYNGATVDNPFEKDWHQCVLLAKLTHITVTSAYSGVLAQWGASGRTESKKGVKKVKAVATTG